MVKLVTKRHLFALKFYLVAYQHTKRLTSDEKEADMISGCASKYNI